MPDERMPRESKLRLGWLLPQVSESLVVALASPVSA